MDVKFPLLSILSCAFLLFFALQGGDVELHSIEVGFSADSQGATVTIDPAFLVYADRMYPPCSGEAFGNVAVVWNHFRGTVEGEWIKRFELNHIIQYRALGLLADVAKYVLPLDPPPHCYSQQVDDPSQPDRIEWLPPDGFVDMWFNNLDHECAEKLCGTDDPKIGCQYCNQFYRDKVIT